MPRMAEPATCFPIAKEWSEEERETLLSQMFYFQALRVGEKKKRQSWQPFPRFVHLKAALCGVTAKQRLAQLSVLFRGLLSTACFPLKVSLWNSESWVLPFRSFHTDAKFQDWLWCLSKVARHPAVIIPENCLGLLCEAVIRSSLRHVRRPAAQKQWRRPSPTSRGSRIVLMATRGYMVGNWHVHILKSRETSRSNHVSKL